MVVVSGEEATRKGAWGDNLQPAARLAREESRVPSGLLTETSTHDVR